MKCQCCGRELTDDASIARKMGDDCWNNFLKYVDAAGTSVNRVMALESIGDSDVSKWVRVAKQAIGRNQIAFAKTCFERADRRAALVGVKLPALEAVWCETHFSSDCGDAV